MKRVFVGLVAIAIIMVGTTCIWASQEDDAKALAEKAAAFVKANEKEECIAEIGNPKGQFVKGDLYVVIQNTKGVNLANPMAPGLAGQNHYELKDPNGKYFIKEVIEVATKKGSGWVTYVWANPATKKVQAKKSYVKMVDGTDAYVLCGIFQ